ncbi:hypothetical protein BH766_gp78 [Gordonia phage Demosthenes]|uniref:Uncharacterized protein n=1 Tax=Gordonia phage Demosthenes TaxID=1838067 RepID=A0A166Y6X9_9CAUD|nr:hypothetical protein BH766_gp78 [Gordonia phage Demosthenes]ANA86047.1 hypothetical protein PBI_DEMOSTHENES_78 [Gordonia phage Demosthenes]
MRDTQENIQVRIMLARKKCTGNSSDHANGKHVAASRLLYRAVLTGCRPNYEGRHRRE